MDVARLASATVRRWYLALPLLALTALCTLLVGDRVNPEYEATAAVLFFEAGDEGVANPYGSANQAASAISVIVGGGAIRTELAENGLASDYELAPAEDRPGTSTPIVAITVAAATPELALSTRDNVVAVMDRELAARQTAAGVPAPARTGITVLDAPAAVSSIETAALRAQVVVAALGIALTFLLVVLVDDLLLAAERRRLARSSGAYPTATGRQASPMEAARGGRAVDGVTDRTAHPAFAGARGRDDKPAR